QSLFLIGAMLALIAFTASAQQPNPSEKQRFITIKENMQAAVVSMDKKKLIRAKYDMEDFTNSSNKQMQKLAHYYMGYADYRLNTQFSDVKEDQQEKFVHEAVKYLDEAVLLDPDFADARALLASVYGLKATGIFSGMKYGPKSNSAIENALESAPDNPRVHMINAIGLLKKPSMFGGS